MCYYIFQIGVNTTCIVVFYNAVIIYDQPLGNLKRARGRSLCIGITTL